MKTPVQFNGDRHEVETTIDNVFMDGQGIDGVIIVKGKARINSGTWRDITKQFDSARSFSDAKRRFHSTTWRDML